MGGKCSLERQEEEKTSYQYKSLLTKVLVTDLHLISALLVGCTVNSYKEEKKLFCAPVGR